MMMEIVEIVLLFVVFRSIQQMALTALVLTLTATYGRDTEIKLGHTPNFLALALAIWIVCF